MSNPFETITEIYKDQTEELDKHGYADKFKQGTELFFKGINDDILSDDSKFHFEDIEYLDGYFIFSHGTNSVVHFHIKECPGWKFGIWWEMPNEKEDSGKLIKGECFAQYEEEIDKFKPSASTMRTDISASFDIHESFIYCYEALEMFNFIKNEPYLAFCRHVYGWDYNKEYHSRKEAKAKYEKYQAYKNREKESALELLELDEKVMNFVKEKILPCFKYARIIDNGTDSYPRYKMVAPYSKYAEAVEKPGFYNWFESDDESSEALFAEFESIEDRCLEIAENKGVEWNCPIDSDILFYEDSMSGDESNESKG